MGKINSCWSESRNDSIRGQERLSFPALMDGRPREFDLLRYGMQFVQCLEVDKPRKPERGGEVGFTQPFKAYVIQV